MKPGMVYALGLVVLVLAIVILMQQRKLALVRNDNASLYGDARALINARSSDATVAADLQREVRQLRAENEDLRREIQQWKERTAVRTNP